MIKSSDGLYGRILCCAVEPVCVLLYFTPVKVFWRDPDISQKGPRSQHRSDAAVRDLSNAIVVGLFAAMIVLALLGVLAGSQLDRYVSSSSAALTLIPAIIAAGHGVGWYVGEKLTANALARSADSAPHAVLRRVVVHGTIGWAVVAAILYVGQL